MKSASQILILVCSAVFTLHSSLAQWVQTSGPHGGSVPCFAGSGGNIYAYTGLSGLFQSTDGGRSWHVVNNSPSLLGGYALAITDGNIFAGAGTVLVSSDSGSSWTESSNGLPRGTVQSLISFDGNLFAGVISNGISISTNNGKNWTAVNNGLPSANTSIYTFTAIDTLLFAGGYKGVFLSTDKGTSWSAAGLADSVVNALSVSGGNIFAVTNGGGVFLSTDNGKNWSLTNDGLPDTVTSLIA